MGDAAGGSPDPRGLFASTKGLLSTGVGLVHNRLQLFGVELAEERVRLVSMIAYGGAALLGIVAGLTFLAIFFTVLLWESNRLLVLGVFSALFLVAGIVSLMLTVKLARSASRPFTASLEELRKDRDALATRDGARST